MGAPEPVLEGFLPTLRVSEEPSHQSSSQIPAASALLYFTDVKLLLEVLFQELSPDLVCKEGREGVPCMSCSSGPDNSLRISPSLQLQSDAGDVCVCMSTSDRRARRHCHHREITNSRMAFKVRHGLCIHQKPTEPEGRSHRHTQMCAFRQAQGTHGTCAPQPRHTRAQGRHIYMHLHLQTLA